MKGNPWALVLAACFFALAVVYWKREPPRAVQVATLIAGLALLVLTAMHGDWP